MQIVSGFFELKKHALYNSDANLIKPEDINVYNIIIQYVGSEYQKTWN